MDAERMTDNEYGLHEMHEKLLSALDKLDEICRANDIHYSLHGGTLLGAERNHHLIPWDDDMDISMLRSEYDKLEALLETLDGTDGYYLDRSAMWVPRFVLNKDGEPVFIDIFVWDYISEKRISQILKINLLRFIQGMMKENIHYNTYDLKGKILIFLTISFGKLFSMDKKRRMYRSAEIKAFTGKKKFIHRSNDTYRGITYVHDTEYMSEYQNMLLEGREYMVNRRYKEFLIREYGEDYMTPPPMDARKPSHERVLNIISQKDKEQ